MAAGVSQEILVIDDDEVDQEAIRRNLAKAFPGGVDIRACSTGAEALELIRSRSFGCVFLDYLLPDTNGLGLLKEIYDTRTDSANAPVVMLTGKGSESVMLEALRLGAQDYIVKDNISSASLKITMMKAQELFDLKRSRRQAEDRLQHAQKMEAVGKLTSGVAHDFNNLLTVVLGNVYLLQQQIADSPDGKIGAASIADELSAIETVSKNGAEMVKRMMAFSRQMPLTAQTTSINDCVRDALTLLKASLGQAVEIDAVLAPDLPAIALDVSEFTNVLINMAVNARDAMPKGGKLTFETASVVLDEFYAERHPDVTPGPYIMIAISDTGIGMDPATASKIFEPFFTTKAPGKGTGLGLSMVYGFVRQSGGHIDVYSEQGHGTVFRLYLPRGGAAPAQDAEADVAAPAAATPPPAQDQGKLILVAENDDYVRDIAVHMLENLGYRTLQAKDAQAALELFKRESDKVSLIFADICMATGMDGVELVRQARAFSPKIRAVFTSGYTEHRLRENKLTAQDEFIGKPYHHNALADKIQKALAHGQ